MSEHKTFQEFKEANEIEEILWKDRKRVLGMPLTFTKYELTPTKLRERKGWLNTESHDLLLYRVLDIEVVEVWHQKLFGVGTIIVHASDKSTPRLELTNIRHVDQFKEYLGNIVEKVRDEKRVTGREMFGTAAGYTEHNHDYLGDVDDFIDLDNDGIDDRLD